MRYPVFVLILVVSSYLLSGCLIFDKKSSSSGGGTEVVGTILLEDGKAGVSGAVVEARKVGSEPIQVALNKKTTAVYLSTTTDKNGKFILKGLKEGNYHFKASFITESDTLYTLYYNKTFDGKYLNLGPRKLAKGGGITLRVKTLEEPSSDVSCFIPGITALVKSDETGICHLERIPIGNYTLVFLKDGFYRDSVSDIEVQSGQLKQVEDQQLTADPTQNPPKPILLISESHRDEGIVRLQWKAMKITDIKGFLIYRLNPLGGWEPLNYDALVKETVYVDTVYHPNDTQAPKQLHYRVTAWDNDDNESDFSNTTSVTVDPPNIPYFPSPNDLSENILLNVTLIWSKVYRADSGQVIYDITFDTLPVPETVISKGQSKNYLAVSNLYDNKTYYWKIIAHLGDSAISGPVWSFTTVSAPESNHPPSMPASPKPSDSAVNMSVSVVELNWVSTDDDNDVLSYDVMLAANGNDFRTQASHLNVSKLNIYGLANDATYRWRVLVSDGKQTLLGPVWTFKTKSVGESNQKPMRVTKEYPLNGVGNVPPDVTLLWQAAEDPDGEPVSYNVRMGTSADALRQVKSGISGTQYKAVNLQPGTAYYWNVFSYDGRALSDNSPVWTFTTRKNTVGNLPPNKPKNPTPSNGLVNVPITPKFIWEGGDPDGDTVLYTFHWGEDQNALQTIGVTLSESVFRGLTFKNNTKYYWRVTASDKETNTPGDLWHFTTAAAEAANNPPNIPQLLAPDNGAPNVTSPFELIWRGGDPDGDDVIYSLHLSSSDNELQWYANSTDTAFLFLERLELGATYRWKIVASDNKEATESDVYVFYAVKDTNSPPEKPELLSPQDGALITSLNPTLEWACSDKNGDKLTYELQVGTDSTDLAIVLSESDLLVHRLNGLKSDTKYYWRVVAFDEYTGVTPSDIASFTTHLVRKKVVHWAFEGEGTQSVVGDSSGNGNQLYMRGPHGSWDYYTGIAGGRAMKFYRSDFTTHGAAPVSDELRLKSFTVSWWKNYGNGKSPVIVYTGNSDGGTQSGLDIWVNRLGDGTEKRGALSMQISEGRVFTSESEVIPNQAGFIHLAAVFDHITGRCAFYVNGALAESGEVMPGAAGTSFDSLYVGYHPEQGHSSEHIVFDDIMIWNHVLEKDEIQNIYDNNANHPPDTPSVLSPKNNETSVAPGEITLQWAGGDPNPSDNLTYILEFGLKGSMDESYSVTDQAKKVSVLGGKTYQWRVTAKDGYGLSTSGGIWSFSTENRKPNKPVLIHPVDPAEKSDTIITFVWSCFDPDEDDLKYTLLIYDNASGESPVQYEISNGDTSYSLGGFEENEKYFWQIKADDGDKYEVSDFTEFNIRALPKLKAYWAFEQPIDATSDDGERVFTDSSGHNEHGNYKNGIWVEGIRGQAMDLAGDEQITVSPSANMISNNFSMSFWVKPDKKDVYLPILHSGNNERPDGGSQIALNYAGGGTDFNGNLYVNLRTEMGNDHHFHSTDSGTVASDKWQHIVVTFQNQTKLLNMYIDGVLQESKQLTTMNQAPYWGEDWKLGFGGFNGEAIHFEGALDEFKVYIGVLNQNDIDLIFQSVTE